MCSRPAWPLTIITRRTRFRTRSARTSRTNALSASTDTLTVPGYGRVVVHTPYGIGGGGEGRGPFAAPPRAGRGRGGAAPRGGCRPACLRGPPGGGGTGSLFPAPPDPPEV